MNRFLITVAAIVLAITFAFARTTAARPTLAAGKSTVPRSAKARTPLVEFEMMTWPEVKQALGEGKTTALFYTGGTEQRGPQNANGGHNLMAKATVKAIALRLGDAIAMPVLPYTPNNASAQLPGTIGLTNEILAAILERISEQAILTGFKNVILMGDHGGGQPNVYRDVARNWRTSTRRKAFTCTTVTKSTRKPRTTSPTGSSPTGIRAARTPVFPTRRKCCISAAIPGSEKDCSRLLWETRCRCPDRGAAASLIPTLRRV